MPDSNYEEVDSTLPPTDVIVAQFIEACESRDWATAKELLFLHGMVIWFWIPPHKLAQLVANFPLNLLESSEMAGFLHATLSQPHAHVRYEHDALPLSPNPTQDQVLAFGISAGNMRLVGQQRDSLAFMTSLIDLAGTKSGSFIDGATGHTAMLYLQAGMTALLAGDMVRSEAWHSRVTNSKVDVHFPFTQRDALGKLTLTYLLWSEPELARKTLAVQSEYPVTDSWVEDWVAGALELSDLALNSPAELAQRVANPMFDWHGTGEIWSLIMWLNLRYLMSRGRSAEGLRLIDRVEVLGMPASGGDGIPGSVLNLWRANLLLLTGDYASATAALKDTDSALLETQLALARLEYLTGKPKQALGRLAELPSAVSYFGQTRLEHAFIVTACYLKLGDTERAKQTIVKAVRPDTTAEQLGLALPPASVIDYAQQNWIAEPGLDFIDWDSCTFALAEHDSTVSLSSRELEVMRLLVTELSREEIAGKLHVSENTLKSHLRSIYRKLGVGSRQEAAVVADQYLRRVAHGG